VSYPTLRIGVAGLGTVGVGVVKLLNEQASLVSLRSGRDITITAVSARNAP
jgi:homoserine dehydrogenase